VSFVVFASSYTRCSARFFNLSLVLCSLWGVLCDHNIPPHFLSVFLLYTFCLCAPFVKPFFEFEYYEHHLFSCRTDPVMMLYGPIPATRFALQKANMKIEDIDVSLICAIYLARALRYIVPPFQDLLPVCVILSFV
jgi:hypothetical protein